MLAYLERHAARWWWHDDCCLGIGLARIAALGYDGIDVATVIAGATQASQLEANVKAVGWVLDAAELAEIDRITA